MPKTVLIVEDNALDMRLFDDLLTEHGYNVIKTGNGGDVVEFARDYRPDLILIDIQLPGISGLDALELLRRDPETRKIPAIAVTAFAMKGNREMFLDLGFDDYISKPISVPRYLRTVAGSLNGGAD
ncbi:MAG TPA: response regulator [Rhodospirillaceae bacterium]|jgi:two-component system cell cycle response regulator DivK|nr:response regulator [Rhodospirillaceae bacterium]HIJ93558.1 response regulator [Rhodospirillaceae bacterium]